MSDFRLFCLMLMFTVLASPAVIVLASIIYMPVFE